MFFASFIFRSANSPLGFKSCIYLVLSLLWKTSPIASQVCFAVPQAMILAKNYIWHSWMNICYGLGSLSDSISVISYLFNRWIPHLCDYCFFFFADNDLHLDYPFKRRLNDDFGMRVKFLYPFRFLEKTANPLRVCHGKQIPNSLSLYSCRVNRMIFLVISFKIHTHSPEAQFS